MNTLGFLDEIFFCVAHLLAALYFCTCRAFATSIMFYGALIKFTVNWTNNRDFNYAVYIFYFRIIILVSMYFLRFFYKIFCR